MRILQVHNRYTEPGGEDVVVESERSALEGAGHSVHAMLAENRMGLAGVTSLALSPWNPLSARRLATVLSAASPDVAHVHNTWFQLSPSIFPVLRDAGVPVVATVHNYRHACLNGQLFREGEICTLCVGRHPLPGVVRGCYRGSMPQSAALAVSVSLGRANSFWADSIDRFVAMTDFERDQLVGFGLPADRITVKPHFVEDGGVRTTPPSGGDTLLFVGRLTVEKGVETLLQAWEAASPSNLRLKVVGDGPLRDRLEGSAQSSVEFTGWLPRHEVAAEMRRTRSLLFPSVWYETFGLVAIEAMVAGTPVLASDLGGIPQVLDAAGSDLLAPPGDVDAWAQRLRAIDEGSVDVDEVGSHNRKVYEARYTVERGVAALESLYGSVFG
ncbi:MAG TPA: glycosyltransferase family 4 protein [Acidimicrobiia bacterium]|nr:glycosyltransferase family 4 protein [Acidimicrobiia bacterium]